LAATITAAERAVDELCGRRFDAAGDTPEARVFPASVWCDAWSSFPPESPAVLPTDDYAASGAALAWRRRGSATWRPIPDDCWAPADPGDALRPASGVATREVTAPGEVRLTARFGWPRVPDQVREAAKLLSVRLLHRESSPLGVTSVDAGGLYVGRVDHDVRMLLSPWAGGKVWDGGL